MLVIHGRLPSLNQYVDANRANKYAAAKIKREVESLIGWYIKQQEIQPVDGPVRIEFHWYEPNAKRDIDNTIFGKKFILDALVKNSIIKNDNQKIVRSIADYPDIDRANPRIEVDIIPVE